jgi:hypothetical protein
MFDKREAQSHCHFDGTRYVRASPDSEWPRKCPECGHLQFNNPKPIGVLLQTVTDGKRTGILTPVRGHAPMIGFPAGTGGFQELSDQSSEHAGAREKHEEVDRGVGIDIADEDDIQILCSRATGPILPERRQNLVFSVNPNPVHVSAYDGFVPDAETTAIEVSWEPRVLAFPSHTYALAKYFKVYQGVDAPEAYMRQPRTGDIVFIEGAATTIFNIPYGQDLVDQGLWNVEIEDGGTPIPVRPYDDAPIAPTPYVKAWIAA